MTICVRGKECLFGEIVEGRMHLNDGGRMVQSVWVALPDHYPGVDVDAFVVMPNHVHGIIVLTDDVACPDPSIDRHSCGGTNMRIGLPDVVHRFKSFTTAQYRHGVQEHGWPAFVGRLWQRNYYEHILRDDDELNHARQYIADNAVQWNVDRENPLAPRPDAETPFRPP